MKRIIKNLLAYLPITALVGLVGFSVWSLINTPVHAQSTSETRVCHTAISIDRSGSIDADELERMRAQIRRLFEPTGLYDPKIELAFWMFSNVNLRFHAGENYNAPFSDFIPSNTPVPNSFTTKLNAPGTNGTTNYLQGFGYDDSTRNPFIKDIIEKTDVIVFMTDGQPNAGSHAGMSALESGRWAAQQHINEGRVVVGGNIQVLGGGDSQRRTINYVVSGDYNNYGSTFQISPSFNDLAQRLKEEIGRICKNLFPPDPCPYVEGIPKSDPRCVPPVASPPYNLTPVVNSDHAVISSDETVGFDYTVRNDGADVSDAESAWAIKQVVVDRGQSADPIQTYGTSANPYIDGSGCPQLLNLVGNNGTCQDIASGTRNFPPNRTTTIPDNEVGSAARLVIDDRWPVGTKVCYVFMISKPTEKATPTNRHSRAVCVVIGKRPMVQVYGGDLSVGGQIAGDREPLSAIASKIHVGQTIKSDPVNKIFGSWVEYGAFAPGSIIGLGSASGLQGGYAATSGSLQGLWSKLTFANENDDYGKFADSRTMPDAATALLVANPVVGDIATPSVAFNGPAVASGVYEKQVGDLTLSASKLEKGKSVIVHVPNGTVTIDGNLTYTDEDLRSLNDIPRLVIIARNVYIKGAVTRVDAWLLARNSANGTGGGIVNTCSDGPASLSIADCDQQLRINGPIIARSLLLRRTAGAGAGAASDQPSEIINLRADAYLSSLARRTDIAVPMTTYSVELPPRF